ncbi:hypothetical protein AB1Y20_009605 [Prymnesium parvum]|uniref:Catechol O-methyltransferase n=1 Tax=Prymnesium parvum TaxID=97485 RepID=A0AB34K4F5_PRYPA
MAPASSLPPPQHSSSLPPPQHHGVGSLAFRPTDRSADAEAWRSDPDVARAWLHLRHPSAATAFRHPNRTVALVPGEPDRTISLAQLALAFELGLGPLSLRKTIDAGIGVRTFGVYSQQSVTDIASLHELLWSVQPDLLIEIGTFCGGSAVFFARTMESYNRNAKVITIDRTSASSRRSVCRTEAFVPGPSAMESAHWRELTAAKRIISIVGRTTSPSLLKMIGRHVSAAKAVFVCDDGDHMKKPLIEHWALYSSFVTVGGYYIDTRIEMDCAYAMLTTKLSADNWCRQDLQGNGSKTVR